MAEPDIDLEHLRTWIGRSETVEDVVDASRASALAATLGRDWTPVLGDALPPLWHWTLFWPKVPSSAIGTDGHPRLGGFMPPIPLPRRMWVGGRLTFHKPLRIGKTATRRTSISDISGKSGRSGGLVFVTLRHEISSDEHLAIIEEQDLVYRAAADSADQPSIAPAVVEPVDARADAEWRDAMLPDPVLLFRYSALTFNGHRIHYDERYARDQEAYPGLVVHGPLTATFLADGLRAHHARTLAEFNFRALRPLFCSQEMSICGNPDGTGGFNLWAETSGGETAMSATARFVAER